MNLQSVRQGGPAMSRGGAVSPLRPVRSVIPNRSMQVLACIEEVWSAPRKASDARSNRSFEPSGRAGALKDLRNTKATLATWEAHQGKPSHR
jgi:hypothetical protein